MEISSFYIKISNSGDAVFVNLGLATWNQDVTVVGLCTCMQGPQKAGGTAAATFRHVAAAVRVSREVPQQKRRPRAVSCVPSLPAAPAGGGTSMRGSIGAACDSCMQCISSVQVNDAHTLQSLKQEIVEYVYRPGTCTGGVCVWCGGGGRKGILRCQKCLACTIGNTKAQAGPGNGWLPAVALSRAEKVCLTAGCAANALSSGVPAITVPPHELVKIVIKSAENIQKLRSLRAATAGYNPLITRVRRRLWQTPNKAKCLHTPKCMHSGYSSN